MSIPTKAVDNYGLYLNLLAEPEPIVEMLTSDLRHCCNILGSGLVLDIGNDSFRYKDDKIISIESKIEHVYDICTGLQRIKKLIQPHYPEYVGPYRLPMKD